MHQGVQDQVAFFRFARILHHGHVGVLAFVVVNDSRIDVLSQQQCVAGGPSPRPRSQARCDQEGQGSRPGVRPPASQGVDQGQRREHAGHQPDHAHRADPGDQPKARQKGAQDAADVDPGVNITDGASPFIAGIEGHLGGDRGDHAQQRCRQEKGDGHPAGHARRPIQRPQRRPVVDRMVEPRNRNAGQGGKHEQHRQRSHRTKPVGYVSSEGVAQRDARQHHADDRCPGVERGPHFFRDDPAGGHFDGHDAHAGDEHRPDRHQEPALGLHAVTCHWRLGPFPSSARDKASSDDTAPVSSGSRRPAFGL